MKTLIKSAVLALILVFTYSFSFSQEDTSKTTIGKAIDEVEDIFDSDKAEVDHNHSAFMNEIDEMMEKVKNMEFSGDFDKDYAKMMIEYNQTGIDMAQTEVNKGNNESLKEKARETIDRQKQENDRYNEFLDDYEESGKKHDVAILKDAVMEKLNKMHKVKITGDVDQDFAKLMKMHHEYAIDLHKLQLEHGMSAELKEQARAGIAEQQKDMSAMQEFDDMDMDNNKDWNDRNKDNKSDWEERNDRNNMNDRNNPDRNNMNDRNNPDQK